MPAGFPRNSEALIVHRPVVLAVGWGAPVLLHRAAQAPGSWSSFLMSGQHSQRTQAEATRPLCKLVSEFPHCHFCLILTSKSSPQNPKVGEIDPLPCWEELRMVCACI